MPDVAIKSSRILTPAGIQSGVLLIRDEKIVAIEPEPPSSLIDLVDVGNAVVMPGIIDPHVHINEPGRTEWEGFDTATKAAAAGGITTLIDMPLNASPVTTTVAAFEEKLRAAKNKLHVDCGFWGGIVPGNESEWLPLIKKGVAGFKAFLTHSGIDDFPNCTEDDLRKAMPLLAREGLPLLVHAELSYLPAPSITNSSSYQEYLASRPCAWEDEAIAILIRLCREYRCRTHIVHLSSASSIAQIRNARAEGLPLTVETGQHYLFFDAESIPDGQPLYKCAPPIRDKMNNDALWNALKDGVIDFVATDHSPAPPSMKQLDSGDLVTAWGGIASLQLALPVLWTAAKRHGCSLEDMANWLSTRPAMLPHLTSKGKIAPGFSADLVIWDPEKTFIVDEQELYHRHHRSVYHQQELHGVVQQTWLRGERIFADGKFLHLNRGRALLFH